jgi:hypothetical protein
MLVVGFGARDSSAVKMYLAVERRSLLRRERARLVARLRAS